MLYCSYLNQNRSQPSYYQYSLAWVISAQTPFLLSHHKQPKGPGEKKKKKSAHSLLLPFGCAVLSQLPICCISLPLMPQSGSCEMSLGSHLTVQHQAGGQN